MGNSATQNELDLKPDLFGNGFKKANDNSDARGTPESGHVRCN